MAATRSILAESSIWAESGIEAVQKVEREQTKPERRLTACA
jgi:hypothetical protein